MKDTNTSGAELREKVDKLSGQLMQSYTGSGGTNANRKENDGSFHKLSLNSLGWIKVSRAWRQFLYILN